MINIDELENLAEAKREKNIKFRTFLKNNADSNTLDNEFKELYEKYSKMYDCSKCRNCCKKYHGAIAIDELEKDAKHLGISVEEFKNKYLKNDIEEGTYYSLNAPCDFLVNGECILGECKPQDCKDYPFANKSDRLFSLWTMINNIDVCPIMYEIFEELKGRYNFR